MAKKKKKKIPLRKQLSRAHKKADKALSEFVREVARQAAGVCLICKVGPIQCCFHFVRRGRKILRWDLRNVVGACNKCNFKEYRDPDLSRAWYIRRFGVEQYLELVDKSVQSYQPTLEELQQIIDTYTTMLKAIVKL
jgi:hypothetical protein